MADPFLGEIKVFAFNYAPRGWALCNGQLLSINQNMALFALLGTTYGGNGQTTFALPDLRGRAQLHWGAPYALGQRGGEVTHALTLGEVAAHTHGVRVSGSNANLMLPTNAILANATNATYSNGASGTTAALHGASIVSAGGSQPHENRQPYLTLNFCIALTGIFPSRN